MNHSTALSQILSEFEQLDIPINNHWQPGLSDTEIDEIIGDRSIKLTQGLRMYFRWRNGADGWIVSSYTPNSLQTSIHFYDHLLTEIMESVDLTIHREL